jgi:hypothetical protein
MTHHVEIETDRVFGADRVWCRECRRQFRDLDDHQESVELRTLRDTA